MQYYETPHSTKIAWLRASYDSRQEHRFLTEYLLPIFL